jgi:hypothetical protein
MPLPGNRDDDLIEMPSVPGTSSAAADPIGELSAELLGPAPHRLVADLNSAGRQHLFNHAQAERKAEVQPDRVADHLGWETVASVERWMGFLHAALYTKSRSHRVNVAMPVQRSTVSAIMKKYQAVGWVRQGRGGITITDLTALREVSCECYQTIHDVFVRLLPYAAKKD